MSNDIVKQYLVELGELKQEDFPYTVGGVWPNVHIGPDGVVFELIDNISMDITEILCHKSDWRIKEEVIAANLDGYLELLCDDDNSNDESAIKGIDLWMKNFVIEKEDGGKRYVAYDEKLIEDVMACYNYDGLAHQLLSCLDKQIEMNRESGESDPTVIAELTSSLATIENTYLKVEKYGAGVKLSIISDYDFDCPDDINEVVAYASTETSAKNYFMNGDEYDWDAIEEWCLLELPLAKAAEYNFLSDCLLEMNDESMNKFMEKAQKENKVLGVYSTYDYYDQVIILMAEYEKKAKNQVVAEGNEKNTKKYTRAICCSQVVAAVHKAPNEKYTALEWTDDGTYTAYLEYYDKSINYCTEDHISVYPPSGADVIGKNIGNGIKQLIEPSEMGCALAIADGVIQNAVLSYAGMGPTASAVVCGTLSAYSVGKGYLDDYFTFCNVENGIDLENAVQTYGVHGYLVEQSLAGKVKYNVVIDKFDECKINAATIYYNKCAADQADASEITTQEFKESFLEQNETYEQYYEYYDAVGEDRIKEIGTTIGLIAGYMNKDNKSFKTSNMTPEQANEAAEMYLRMEEYAIQHPEEYEDFVNLEQLSDTEKEALYRKVA